LAREARHQFFSKKVRAKCIITAPVEPQYLRRRLAEYLKRPERAGWRVVYQKLDDELRKNTVTYLQPYFT
jgi:hypothetical protein